MRVIYKLTNGIASDILQVRPTWPLPPGFLEVTVTQYPTVQSLSDPAAWAAQEVAQAAKKTRHDLDLQEQGTAAGDNAVAAMLDRNPAQIATYIDNQATDLAGVRAVLKLLARMLVVIARRAFR